MSLSCPDLQPKEVLVFKRHLIDRPGLSGNNNNNNNNQTANVNNLNILRNTQQAQTANTTNSNTIANANSGNNNNNNDAFLKIARPSSRMQLIRVKDPNTQTYKFYILARNDTTTGMPLHVGRVKLDSTASRVLNPGSLVARSTGSTGAGGTGGGAGTTGGGGASAPSTSNSTVANVASLGVSYNKRRDSFNLNPLKLSAKISDTDAKAGTSVVEANKKTPTTNEHEHEQEQVNHADEEDEEDEDDEDEEDDDDDDDDEECDNCLTRNKYGNYLYKYGYKPVKKSLKFMRFSIAENLKLFKLFKFCVFVLCNFILCFFYESPFYFVNAYMMENGQTANQGASVTAAVGIFSVFSSIMYGYIGDLKKINPIILYSVSLIACGLCCCAVPLFIQDYIATMTLLVLIGSLISVSDVLVPIICVNIVGYDDLYEGF